MFLRARGIAIGAALAIGLGALCAGTVELGRLLQGRWPTGSVLGRPHRALTLPSSLARHAAKPVVPGAAAAATVRRAASAAGRRSHPTPGRPRARLVAMIGPVVRRAPVVGPATRPRPPVGRAPQPPLGAAPVAPPPGGSPTGTPGATATRSRAHLSLVQIEFAESPGGSTGSRLLMRFAVRDRGDQPHEASSAAPLPDEVVVRVSVPDLPVAADRSSALRLSVDLVAGSTAATGSEDAGADAAAVRVRLALTDGSLSAPVALEGPAAADGASNTVEVLAPLPGSDSAPADTGTGEHDEGAPPAGDWSPDGSEVAVPPADGLGGPLASDATQVVIPMPVGDAPAATGTMTVDVAPSPAAPAEGQDTGAPPAVSVTIDVEAMPAPPADVPAPASGSPPAPEPPMPSTPGPTAGADAGG